MNQVSLWMDAVAPGCPHRTLAKPGGGCCFPGCLSLFQVDHSLSPGLLFLWLPVPFAGRSHRCLQRLSTSSAPGAAAAPEGLKEQEPGVSKGSQTLPGDDTIFRVTLALG